MKKTLLIIVALSFFSPIFSQEVELKGIFANSSSNMYKTSYGYGVGYNQHIKSKNRLGISFTHYFSTTDYDEIYGSNEDGISTYIKNVEPNNRRMAFKLNYAFRLVNNPKSSLYLGPEIGLNMYRIRENYHQIANGELHGGYFSNESEKNFRFGLGFLLEFELKEVFHKRISTFLSVNPEITSFDEFGSAGGYHPEFIAWMNFSLGIRYSFKR